MTTIKEFLKNLNIKEERITITSFLKKQLSENLHIKLASHYDQELDCYTNLGKWGDNTIFYGGVLGKFTNTETNEVYYLAIEGDVNFIWEDTFEKVGIDTTDGSTIFELREIEEILGVYINGIDNSDNLELLTTNYCILYKEGEENDAFVLDEGIYNGIRSVFLKLNEK